MLVQKALALGQQVLIGRATGLGEQADAFYAAQTVPLLLGSWIMFGLSNTLVPMIRATHPSRLTGALLCVLGVLGVASVWMALAPATIIGIVVPGLPAAAADLAAGLLRKMAIVVVLMGLSGILNGLYYEKSRFLVPSIAGCLLYTGPIAGAFFQPWLGIDCFAWGLAAGSIVQAGLLAAGVRGRAIPRPVFAWGEFAGFGRSLAYILSASAVSVLCMILDRAFSSSAQTGAITAVTMASSLMTLPSSLVVTSLSSALLPALVALKNDPAAFSAMSRKALAYTAFFLAPASWLLLAGAQSIVNLLFHSASVDRSTMLLTGGMLEAYSLGILAIAFKDVIGVVFIAVGRAAVPMVTGAVILAVSVISKILYPIAEHPAGIALTTSFAMWVGVGVLAALLSARVRFGWTRFWAGDGWKLALVNGLFGGLCLALRPVLHDQPPVATLAILAATGVAYVASARALGFSARTSQTSGLRQPARYPDWLKRTLDLTVAVPLFIAALPVMALCAVAVRALTGTPILYRQERTGLEGRIFVLRKFRTLSQAATRDGAPLSDAERLTALGRFLRRFSLDELPQIWSVISGEMSLVGPRPLLPQYLSRYNDFQRRRHECLPGLTGWAQVQGRNAVTWERKFELDVWYVDNRSFWLDLRILLMTAKVVFTGRGVSQPGHATTTEFMGSPPPSGATQSDGMWSR